MGRTGRLRASKKFRAFRTCQDTAEVINLNSWLTEQGVVCNKKLVMATFDDIGRGVLTKKKIYPGEELLNMPLNVTINITTLLMDGDFNRLFIENQTNCYETYQQKLSFQSLLALYLVYHRSLNAESKWCQYLKSLPTEYTVPYFLPRDVQCYLDAKILSVISRQSDDVQSSYNIFTEILKTNTSNIVNLKSFREFFSLDQYEWAYFTVNTRCVYMDLTKLLNMKKQPQFSVLNLLSDNTKIALCPYLDMINHSPKSRNETKLLLNKYTENISIEDVKSEIFSDVKFSIYTNNFFDPYTQIFICYGDSYNLKLITEYGFILPNNELDFIPFDFESVEEYLKTKDLKLSEDQKNFIANHGLNKDLYIDFKGLSFNFYALLMVVKCYYKQNSDVSKIIYSSMDVFSESSSFNHLIAPLVNVKIVNIQKSVDNLVKYGNRACVILRNCVELQCQYITILKKFIKS